jgi:hypothetical protein
MGVNLVIVTDHRSVDSTPAILDAYARAGRVFVLREESASYEQSRWVTRMTRMAYEMGATWVINGDADEFWWPRTGNLSTALSSIPASFGVLSVTRTDLPPVVDETGPFWQRMVYREVTSYNLLGQPLPAKVCHRARSDVVVAQGNHSVAASELGDTLDDGRIQILHYPLRTFRQFERKIVNGGSAYEAPGSPPMVGGTWRHAYRLWQAGRLNELYDPHVLTPDRVAQRLVSGTIVRDARLRDLLGAISRGGLSRSASRPAGDEAEASAASWSHQGAANVT